jgi:hypothetical protein
MTARAFPLLGTLLLTSSVGCATLGSPFAGGPPAELRRAMIARATVWTESNIATKDLKAGPRREGAFPFRDIVRCEYVDKPLEGNSPKFACRIGDADEVKVKYGGANGEVYGEVLATRLLWALGFGADAMYPVNVICHGCPDRLGGTLMANGDSRFDPAIIERKFPAGEWPKHGPAGWSWRELDEIAPDARGATRAQRDALKLLAVLLQHTDSKPQQQRILCLGERVKGPDNDEGCEHPFLLINDLGLTFGRATQTNANDRSSVNLAAWRKTPVWKEGDAACVGNLPRSITGTLSDPRVSEDGRAFLAGLLSQLTDRQLHDLFEAARVELRLRAPEDVSSGFPTIDEWVAAFVDKRRQITERRCS